MHSSFRCNFMTGIWKLRSSYVLAAGLLAACSNPDEDEPQMLRDTDDPGSVAMMDASVPQSDEDGGAYSDAASDAGSFLPDASTSKPRAPLIYIVSSKANGTGCPPGTTDVEISSDGKGLLVHFAAFEAVVDKNKTVDIKDCQLGIKVRSPEGISFSVLDFRFNGYASLAKGVTARLSTKLYFQGQPVANQRETRRDLVGPFDDTFTFRDTVGIADLVWSPCGVERDLNIRMTLRLQNAPSKKDGYINLESAHDLKLAWRACGGRTAPPSEL